MIKKTKELTKLAIVILLGILTFNIVYDIGISSSVNLQEEKEIRDITNLDKVKAIAVQESLEEIRPTIEKESSKSKIIKYSAIIGILLIAVAMLVILANKEDLD